MTNYKINTPQNVTSGTEYNHRTRSSPLTQVHEKPTNKTVIPKDIYPSSNLEIVESVYPSSNSNRIVKKEPRLKEFARKSNCLT